MSSECHISVVVPTLNKSALVDRTLSALACQQIPGGVSWEVVVVNDGSTDDTAAVLSGHEARFPVPLRVISPGRNVGRARARNLGLAAAQGQWVLFLDDDILAPAGLLAAHLALLQDDSHAGSIGFVKTEPSLIDAPHFHYLDQRGVAKLAEGSSAPGRYFVTQNAAAPRWALDQVGGFHEGFSGYGFEDMELAFRLEDHCGIGFRTLKFPVPLHIHHHTLAAYLDKKVMCGESSLRLLARLHPRRLREMKLHLVIDAPGYRPAFGVRMLRALLGAPFDAILRRLVARWPHGRSFRPWFPRFYATAMNLAILTCYRKGLRGGDDCQNTAKTQPK